LDARGVHLLAGGIDQLFEVGVHPADHIVLEPIRAAAATSFQVKSLTRRASAAATLPVLHSSRCSPPRQHSSPVWRVAYGPYARSTSSCRAAGLVGNGPRHRRPSVAAVL
jgi:hypothetical protein